jgi:hypothetical protein
MRYHPILKAEKYFRIFWKGIFFLKTGPFSQQTGYASKNALIIFFSKLGRIASKYR